MMVFKILVTTIVILSVGIAARSPDAFEKMIKALEQYKATGIRPQNLESVIRDYYSPNSLQSSEDTSEPSEVCTTCALVVDLVLNQRSRGMSDSDLIKEFVFFCNLYTHNTKRVCEGQAALHAPILLYIADHTANITGKEFCDIAFQPQDCTFGQLGHRFNWTIQVPSGNSVPKLKATGAKTFNILHITDIHYDPRYTTGKTNDCGEPVCCQDDQPDGATEGDKCGYWSDYKQADIPWRTVENALQQTKNHEFDYVYFTGDIVPHRIWNTSVLDNTQIIAQILDSFGQHYQVPVYPSLGNHEAHPCDEFSEITNSSLSTNWLFDVLYQKLSKWMPIDEVKDTVKKGGYYSVSPRKGLRVVVLNNNVCNTNNWWLIHNPRDPYDQLKWLAEVLSKAEKNNERVHLLHHMPSGRNECFRVWAREYRKLIDRFANTVSGQFNGHTHRDEFYVYYNRSNPTQAINMAWNGASIVTYDLANPSYKLLSIDDETFDLLDFEEWTYNLTLANMNGGQKPEWYKLYSFKEAYGVKSLQPEEINSLVFSMTKKHGLIDQYYRYKFRNGDIALEQGCDDDCKKDLLCTMVRTEYGDDLICDKLKRLYDHSKNIEVKMV